jgi:hypothetical protein
VDIIPYAIGWLLVATLLLGGTLKAADPAGTAASLRDYGLLRTAPVRVGGLAAAFELAAALLLAGTLLVGIGRSLGFAVALALFTFFAGLQARSLILGRQHPCGCFGRGELVTGRTLVRSALLVAAGAVALAATLGGAPPQTGMRLLLSFVLAAAAITIATAAWIVRAGRAPLLPELPRAGGIFAARPSTTKR